jgi:hypothetical protein
VAIVSTCGLIEYLAAATNAHLQCQGSLQRSQSFLVQAAASGAFDPEEAAEFIVCGLDLLRYAPSCALVASLG